MKRTKLHWLWIAAVALVIGGGTIVWFEADHGEDATPRRDRKGASSPSDDSGGSLEAVRRGAASVGRESLQTPPVEARSMRPSVSAAGRPLIARCPHPPASDDAREWLAAKYEGLADSELKASHDAIREIAFDEVSIYVDMREDAGDYRSWIGSPGESAPHGPQVRGDCGRGGVYRYRTRRLPSGDVEHRWFNFSVEEYPDVASRTFERSWIHQQLHSASGCLVCD